MLTTYLLSKYNNYFFNIDTQKNHEKKKKLHKY